MQSAKSPTLPNPNSSASKDLQVREMFSRIVPTYDLLNRLLSLGFDQHWRAHAVRRLNVSQGSRILDLCGGTGDFARKVLGLRSKDTVHVADFCFPMLGKARDRLRNFGERHGTLCGDALRLPFANGSFEACLCGFGVRNWADLEAGLAEVHRVLVPGGEFAVLDFFQAGAKAADRLGRFYVRKVLPCVGGVVSGNREAYQYLADSMDGFCSPQEFVGRAAINGFEMVEEKRFLLGMCWLFLFRKP